MLDEPSSKEASSNDAPDFVQIDSRTGSFGPVEETTGKNIVLDGDLSDEGSLHLEISEKIVLDPIAQASRTAMLEERKRLAEAAESAGGDPTRVSPRRHAPPPPPPGFSKPNPKSAVSSDVDFGAMSALDEDAPVAEERTVRVQAAAETLASPPEPRSEVIPITRNIDRGGATEIRVGVKVPPAPQGPSPVFSSAEAGLKQSESLRIAQNKITELERELERVRRDNESLSTAGDTLRRRADELASKAESFEIQARESAQMLDEEKKVMRGQLQTKDREIAEMRSRVEEIETRLESNFKKIRVRERELEHRLEIVKMESATLVSSKDKMILDLKRQIDQLHHEGDSAKSKTQEVFNQYKEKQETIRRVVRALRIALTILEGDDESNAVVKKPE